MSITRFKKSLVPAHNPNLTARENEDLERHVERVNNIKNAVNKLFDMIDKYGRQDRDNHDDYGNDGPEMG